MLWPFALRFQTIVPCRLREADVANMHYWGEYSSSVNVRMYRRWYYIAVGISWKWLSLYDLNAYKVLAKQFPTSSDVQFTHALKWRVKLFLPITELRVIQNRGYFGTPVASTGKKLEVNLTQNGLPQLQDLYHHPLLPQCMVRAFVYSKFQYGMNICVKPHQRLVDSAWIVFRVHPMIHEYSESYTPLLGQKTHSQNIWISFATQFFTGQGG